MIKKITYLYRTSGFANKLKLNMVNKSSTSIVYDLII